MSLIAYRASDGVEVESFSIDQKEWDLMRAEPKGAFLMFGTDWPAVLKRSIRGLQHFAHASGFPGQLPTPESEEHQYAKIAVVRGLRSAGFQAWVERGGTAPDGGEWVADVLCRDQERLIAFEVQLAAQTLEEYEQRTSKYLQAGIKCVWIAKSTRYATLMSALAYKAQREGTEISRPGGILIIPGLAHMPAVPLKVPEKKDLSDQSLLVVVFQDDKPAHLTIGDFAVGVMRGALVFTSERQWRWKGEPRGTPFQFVPPPTIQTDSIKSAMSGTARRKS